MIQAKAEAYRKLSEGLRWIEWWRQHYGPLPVPLWVAPTEERALAVYVQWRSHSIAGPNLSLTHF